MKADIGLESPLNRDTETDLLRRAAGGDRLAFTRIVEANRAMLTALVGRMTGDASATEDIVQEVFARAWIRTGDWEPEGRARYATWLARIAVNLAIDTRRRTASAQLADLAEPADPLPLADAQLVMRERLAALTRAVAKLPERQRAAIALTYDAGMSNADAATAMEASIGALELLLVRARRTLRTALKDMDL